MIESAIASSAIGNAGTVEIQAQSLSLTNESQLRVANFGQGNAGSILSNLMGLAVLLFLVSNSKLRSNAVRAS